jgi:DNA polymerase III subunit delta'
MKEHEITFDWPQIGNFTQADFFQKSLINQKLNHAYIFCGPRSVGKKQLANYFIQSIFCDNYKNKQGKVPCQECPACQQFKKGIYPDYIPITVDPEKKEISIEQIKILQYQLKLKSFLENYKVALITRADKLNDESNNALLKTLEEPFPKTIIILVTDQLNWIYPTIISRSQIVKFHLIKEDLIYQYLVDQGMPREKVKLLVKLAAGRPGFLFQNDLDESIDDHQQKIEYLQKLLESPVHQKIKLIDQLLKNEEFDFEQLSYNWLTFFRDIFLIKTDNQDKIVNQQQLASLLTWEKKFSWQGILSIIKRTSDLPQKLHLNINPKILLENLIINL